MSEYLYPNSYPINIRYPKVKDFTICRRDDNFGFGVLCRKSFIPGELVASMYGSIVQECQQHTLQIDSTCHLLDLNFAGYLLHSCEPNIQLDMTQLIATCIRPINSGEFLTIDYSATEDVLFKQFACCCKSKICRGWIAGKKETINKITLLNNKEEENSVVLSTIEMTKTWWTRDDLHYNENDRLLFSGRDVNNLAVAHGTPSFFYSAQRIKNNIIHIYDAFNRSALANSREFLIMYAMKANRFAPVLTYLKTTGLCGIDACSPNEVEFAMSCGFVANEISFTASYLSDHDMDRLSKIPGLLINFDSLTAIHKWGKCKPGSSIGLRINPACGVGRKNNEKLQYFGYQTTKFGIYKEQIFDAIAIAKLYDLRIVRLHFHTGSGYVASQLAEFEQVLVKCMEFVDIIGTIDTVNIGGGLGVPHCETDESLNLDAWVSVLCNVFLNRKINIIVEPGNYVVMDAGILVLKVNTVEKKRDTTFVGVNGGFNIAVEPVFYNLPFHPIPALQRHGEKMVVTIAGNINEAHDIFFRNLEIGGIEDSDILVLINAGAYASSMSSNHCMRGEFKEFLLL